MNFTRITILYALTALLTMVANTLAMSDQLKEFQRAFDAAKYELQGIKSTFGVEDEKLLRERRHSIDELLANFQTNLNMENEAEGNNGGTGEDSEDDSGGGDAGVINERSTAAYRGRDCKNGGRCGGNWCNNRFSQRKATAARMAPVIKGGRTGKPKKRVDFNNELNEVAKLNKKYKNPNRPFRPEYGPNGIFNFGEKQVEYPNYNKPLISSSYNTAYNVMNTSGLRDNLRDSELIGYSSNKNDNRNNNYRESNSNNNNGYYSSNNNNNNKNNNNKANNNNNGNSNYRNNNNNNNNNNKNTNNNNYNNNHNHHYHNNNNRYNSELKNSNKQAFANNKNNNNYQENNNNRNGYDNSYGNKDNSNDNSNNNNANSGYNNNNNAWNNKNNNNNNNNDDDNPFGYSDTTDMKQLTIFSNKPATVSGNNNNNKGYNSNDNRNSNNNNYNSNNNNDNINDNNNDNTDSSNNFDDNYGNKIYGNNKNNAINEYNSNTNSNYNSNDNNNKNNNNKYNLDSDNAASIYLKSLLVSPTIYDSSKHKKTTTATPNIVDLLPHTTYDQTIAHVAFPGVDDAHLEIATNPLVPINNDQMDVSKNDLSHEANYKLSKIEQDAAEASKPAKNWDSWRSQTLEVAKRNTFNPLDEIKLKTSSRLMEKGFGASLPSATLADMQRERKLDDILRRLEFGSIKSDPKPGNTYSDINKWNLLLAKEIDDNEVSLLHGFDKMPSSQLVPQLSADNDAKYKVHESKWEPLLSRVGEDDEYYGIIKARLKRLIDLHHSKALSSTTVNAPAAAAVADAPDASVQNQQNTQGSTRTKRISEGLDPKVVNAILQLQREVSRGNRMKRFIGEGLLKISNVTQAMAFSEPVSVKQKSEAKLDEKKSPAEIQAEMKTYEPMLTIMAKDFINDKVLAEDKKEDEKAKVAEEIAKADKLIANIQEQTKSRVENIIAEKETVNKENPRNAKATVVAKDADVKRVKRAVYKQPLEFRNTANKNVLVKATKGAKNIQDLLENAAFIFSSELNQNPHKLVSINVKMPKKIKILKRRKRSLNVDDEIFYEGSQPYLESGDSRALKRQKRDLKTKDSEVHSRHKRSIMDFFPSFHAAKNTTSTLIIRNVENSNRSTTNDSTDETTTHKLQKRSSTFDDEYNDNSNDNIPRYASDMLRKPIHNNDYEDELLNDKHSRMGFKKRGPFSFNDATHAGFNPQQFDNLKEKEASYNKLDSVKFDNMWYENSNNKLNDFRNLLMENRLNNNVQRFHGNSKMKNNVVVDNKSKLHGHNVTANPFASPQFHDAEEPPVPENATETVTPPTRPAIVTSTEAPQTDIDIAVPVINNETTTNANATYNPMVLNDADRNLILQLRDQVLNCTAFSQLESLLKSFEGHPPMVGNHSQIDNNTSVENQVQNESAPPTNKQQQSPHTQNEAPPHPKSMSVTMSFDKKGGTMTIANQKKSGKFDDKSHQVKLANLKESDNETPAVGTESRKKDDMVKLNITINANVVGDQKSNNYYGNGTINVTPGSEDRNRRNVMFPDLGDFDKYEEYNVYANEHGHDQKHNKDDEPHDTQKHKQCKDKSHKHKTKDKCKSKSKVKGKEDADGGEAADQELENIKGTNCKNSKAKQFGKEEDTDERTSKQFGKEDSDERTAATERQKPPKNNKANEPASPQKHKPPSKEKNEKGKNIEKVSDDELEREPKKKGKGKIKTKGKEKEKDGKKGGMNKLKTAKKPNKEESEKSSANQHGLDNIASGKLSSQVVQSIFSMVNTNPRLKPLLPALKTTAPKSSQKLKNFYALRNKNTESQVVGAEKLFQQAMQALNEVIDQQMRSRTCIPLRPDLAVFYEQILKSFGEQEKVRLKRDAAKRSLATDFSKKVRAIDPNKIEERSRIVKKLLKQYEDLPQQDQEQVSGLRDDLLMDLVYLRKIRQSQDMQERHKREILKQEETQGKKIDADIMQKLEKDYSPSFLKLLKTAELFKEASVDTEVV